MMMINNNDDDDDDNDDDISGTFYSTIYIEMISSVLQLTYRNKNGIN